MIQNCSWGYFHEALEDGKSGATEDVPDRWEECKPVHADDPIWLGGLDLDSESWAFHFGKAEYDINSY